MLAIGDVTNAVKRRKLLFILVLFFALRLTNLTLLPIFNDEAIYLDWGFRQTEPGGDLYHSLRDSKQPLLIWIFGIFERILPDPLFAGRLVSVLFGCATLFGIYKLARKIFDEKTALISSLFYSVIPIFAFYDRQALMESAISAIGVWSCFFLINLIETGRNKYAYFLGIALGVGFLIKSSSAIFILASILIGVFYLFRIPNKAQYIKRFAMSTGVIILINFILILNPTFWNTLHQNAQYSLTLNELISFPLAAWSGNLIGNMEILFIFLTPIILFAGVVGIVLAARTRNSTKLILSSFVLICFALETLTVRNVSQRYLVPYLPLLSVFAAYSILYFFKKRLYLFTVLLVSILIPIFLSSLMIFKPQSYILTLAKISKYSETGYISGFTSGYGLPETIEYLNSIARGRNIFVGFALNAGNPESAIIAYFKKSKNIQTGYLDNQLLADQPKDAVCMAMEGQERLYFVSRDEQQAGLNKYFVKLKTFKNPYGQNSIGIYATRENCVGKTIKVRPVK
jgi:4-amino-4-deoxy-L-arabinose transferase-like glycosyltransferase